MELPEGTRIAYGYDAAGRVESIAATTGASESITLDYERDASGAITAVNDTRYGYDELDRLISWYDPSADATTTYTYDANYNLTAVSVDGALTESFSFDGADRISNAGYVYDDAGNLTSDTEFDYLYDSANRLVEVQASGESTAVARYGYDSANRRLWAEEGGETTFFHYDGTSANVIAETGEDGQTIATYAYDAAGRLHSMSRGEATYYYITDAHGDVIALTDQSGDIVNEYSYDPYGNPIQTQEGVDNPYRYAGYRFDEESGLYYCWNRYYDVGTYRFITADLYPGELQSPVTMNAYAYCFCDPVNLIDPLGLLTVSVGAEGRASAVLGYSDERSIAFDGTRFMDYRTRGAGVGGANPQKLFHDMTWSRGGLAAEAGVGPTFMVTSADSVCDLSGPSRRIGVTGNWWPGTTWSIDFVWSSKYWGFQFAPSVGAVGGLLGAVHGGAEVSEYLPPTNRNISGATVGPVQSDQWSRLRSQDY